MTEFFASLYEFFGLLPFYSKDFADHLRGWAADCSGYTGTIWYNIIAITMTGVTALGYALMYHIIDSPKWNKKTALVDSCTGDNRPKLVYRI